MLRARCHRLPRHLGTGWATRGSNTVIEDGVIVDRTARVRTNEGGLVTLGAGTSIGRGALLETWGGSITTGRSVWIGPNCVVYGHGGLTIGADTMIAAGAVIIPANHGFADRSTPISKQEVTALGIAIGSDVWIGAHATILDGVTVGDGAVVAAAAVVSRSVEPFTVVAGVPARVISTRGAT
jgi:acetyltransferase-like isoleucine patch superfamily enzyme